MAKRRKREPTELSQLMRMVFPSGQEDAWHTVRAFAIWEKAVPKRVLEHARPVSLKNGTLYVHVENSAWSQELSFLSEEILQAVRREVPEARVRKLRFRVAPLPPVPPPRRRFVRKYEPLALAELPPALAAEIAQIKDEDVRAKILETALLSLGERHIIEESK